MHLTRLIRRAIVAGLLAVGAAALAERLAIRKWQQMAPAPPRRRIKGDERYLATADGARLRLMEVGEGPLVVLCHGIGGRLDHWSPIAQELAASGHRVVAYDQRGHNGSTRGTKAYTPETLGADLLEVIAHTGGRASVVAGHSLGGITIQAALSQGLAEVADSMVLVSSLHTPAALAAGQPTLEAQGLFLKLAKHPVHGLVLMRPGFGADPHGDDLEELRQNWTDLDPDTFRDALEGLADFDFADDLAACRLPTRVVCGTRDRVTPRSKSRQIADLLTDSHLELVTGVGHMAIWEASTVVLEHIVESSSLSTDRT